MGKFKAGDRIRAIKDDFAHGWKVGDEFDVFLDEAGDPIFKDNDGDERDANLFINSDLLELVPLLPTADEIGFTTHPDFGKEVPVETLRDKFAMAALTGCLAGTPGEAWDTCDWAKAAYAIADAMLAEREKSA